MKYREMAGEKISVLGFGCMRFPTTSKNAEDIDAEKSAKMLEYAIEKGVNYFDTAYVYHGGKSESFIGGVLKPYRDKIHIATKCPTWEVKCEEDFDRLLNEQLERLQTDYIDFYLMHALDKDRFKNVVEKFNLIDKLNKAKADGKIRHIGFSFHDDVETFKKIIDANPNWEFCQIQLNYINVKYQAGLEGLEYAHKKGLDVVIMEPLLGGKLANPSPQVAKMLSDEKTPVEWVMDFLWNREEVSLLLSGMGAMEQVQSNIGYADKAEVGMLTEENLNMRLQRQKRYLTKWHLYRVQNVRTVCLVRSDLTYRKHLRRTMQPLHSVQTEQRQFMQNLTRVRTNVRNAKNVKKSVRRVLKSVTQ